MDNSRINKFYGLEVFRPTRENCSKYQVVVASNVRYDEIAQELTEYGLKELKDFIPYQALGKKVVLVHGNCYVEIVEAYLNTSKTFRDQYWIYPIPLIQHNTRGYIKDHLLDYCDVLIYQDIRETNPFDRRLSAEYLTQKVKKKKICIPNLNGMGKIFFPQAEAGNRVEGDAWNNPRGAEMQGGLFNYRDANIDRLWRSGERDILKIAEYLRGSVYDEKYIRDSFEQILRRWEEREQQWDVKLTDYVKREYQNEQMFYEYGHPCNNILRKVSEGILEILGIDKEEISEIEIRFGVSEMPVYNCVKEALGLKYERTSIRTVSPEEKPKLTEGEMDLVEYVREYCYWCYDFSGI